MAAFDMGEVFPSSLRGCAGLNPVSTLFSFSSFSVLLFPSSDVFSVIDLVGSVITSASAPRVEITLSVMPIISMALVLSATIILSVRLSVGLSVVLIFSVILVVSTVAVVLWV